VHREAASVEKCRTSVASDDSNHWSGQRSSSGRDFRNQSAAVVTRNLEVRIAPVEFGTRISKNDPNRNSKLFGKTPNSGCWSRGSRLLIRLTDNRDALSGADAHWCAQGIEAIDAMQLVDGPRVTAI
jgi:hypothetical protein